jgi:hypothetical protein
MFISLSNPMSKFFRRRSLPQEPTDLHLFDSSQPFIPDHEFMSGWQQFPASSIVSELPKLLCWLSKHPEAAPNFSLRRPIGDPPARHSDFCQYALRSQILQGFKFLADCDQLISDSHFIAVPPIPPHPFPGGRNLTVVAGKWRDLLRAHTCLTDVQAKAEGVQGRIGERVGIVKEIVEHLIALLASTDAIPEPFIPVVSFASCGAMLNDPELMRAVGSLKDLVRYGSRCLQTIANATMTMTSIAFWYSKGGPFESSDRQVEGLHHFVADAVEAFDQGRGCMMEGFDGSMFADLFAHPESLPHPIYGHFMSAENRNGVGMRQFTEMIVMQFAFMDQVKARVVNAVVSALFAPAFAPELVFDGTGTVDKEELDMALELVAIDDPIKILAVIANTVQAGETRNSLIRVVEVLGKLTSSAHSILRFAHDFTNQKYLPERSRAVREAIAEFLGLKN